MVQVGDTLGEGRYEVEGVLGKGGMATVFRVRDPRLRIARALKILDPELSARAGLRKRFEVEAHAMAKLNHVNIVRVFDVVDDGSHFYIVMELIGGPSVLDLIDDGRLDEADCDYFEIVRTFDELGIDTFLAVAHLPRTINDAPPQFQGHAFAIGVMAGILRAARNRARS